MKAPPGSVGGEEVAADDDFRADCDKVLNSFAGPKRVAMPAIAIGFVFALHRAQQVNCVGDLVLVNQIGMMGA
jgi:hypothetical protein